MKISQVKIKNFRAYRDEQIVDFNDLTVFVGKNDVGKSSILEALDIFFNEGKGTIKIDKEDINKQNSESGQTDILISVVFEDLPDSIIIDSTNQTSLTDEYLLTSEGKLEITKVYPNAGKEKVYIRAHHPKKSECADLLLKKQADLKKIIENNEIACEDKTRNAVMRRAIWSHYQDDLDLDLVEIDASKEDAKNIWNQLKNYLPLYSLFQSDRKNSDGDSEVQDPMKLAVSEIFKDSEINQTLDEIASKVNEKLSEIANRTCEKLREMNPEIADSLNPVIPATEDLKWGDVFKNVSIAGDDDIPLNKRGSGVKRLILLNFFRAEVERRKSERHVPNVVYAVEEPETSQHPDHQKKLIEAFISLSNTQNTQILMTTHSPAIVKMLEFAHLKLISDESDGKQIVQIEENKLPYPSLNEVNFYAFDVGSDEYHNELYGFIEYKEWLDDYKVFQQGTERTYKRIDRNNNEIELSIILSEYIRHQIHHPENNLNNRYSHEELSQSILAMREFIEEQKRRNTETVKRLVA
ncbi:MAG: AAA family ATPase [Alphaproteobacteria bacterium]